MAAIDDEQNDLDAAEGLADLNRIALQDLPINREDEEMEGIAVNGPYDESDLLSTQFSSRKEAYRALQLDSYHRTKLKGLYQIVSGKNVCRVVCMGDKLKLDEGKIEWDAQQKRFVNERLCCSYRTVIRRVTKKEEGSHYIIDGNSNFGHNQRCQLRRCKRTTTVQRRILSKLKVVKNLPGNTKGAHVANALSVDAGIRVSKVYAKRVLGDATGLTKSAFRKAFTELPCLIDCLNSDYY